MEQQQSIFSFSFDDTGKDHIKTISTWAGINAVLAFIGLALDVVSFAMLANSPYFTRPSLFTGFIAGNGFLLFTKLVVSILLNVFLYMASRQLRKGLQGLDNGELTKGFASLRTYYKIYGIVVIVMIILCVLLMLVMSSFRRY